jgi:hypothetical protein
MNYLFDKTSHIGYQFTLGLGVGKYLVTRELRKIGRDDASVLRVNHPHLKLVFCRLHNVPRSLSYQGLNLAMTCA